MHSCTQSLKFLVTFSNIATEMLQLHFGKISSNLEWCVVCYDIFCASGTSIRKKTLGNESHCRLSQPSEHVWRGF